MDQFHDSPPLQLFQARAHIRAGHSEGLGDQFCVQRFLRDVEQRVNLRHGPVDAPTRAHFTPVEDKLLLDWREVIHLFLSIQKLRYSQDMSTVILQDEMPVCAGACLLSNKPLRHRNSLRALVESRATLWAPEQAACAPITPQNPGSQISQVCGPWRSPLGSRRGRPDERGHVGFPWASAASGRRISTVHRRVCLFTRATDSKPLFQSRFFDAPPSSRSNRSPMGDASNS